MIVTLHENPLQFIIRRGTILTSDFSKRFRLNMREARRVCKELERHGLIRSERGGLGWPANECRWTAVS